jgi:Glycosyltransferase family 9 (heptosyltransferase)
MGIGDEIMATGMARGAAARGVRIAFGDGRRIIWGPWSEQAFRNNPNIAPARPERCAVDGIAIEWIKYYKGHRNYNRPGAGRWIWNYDFSPTPGEFYFDAGERALMRERRGILIEPNVPWQKSVAPNKDWGLERYQMLAGRLRTAGIQVFQFSHGRARLAGVEVVNVANFRAAAAALAGMTMAIVPEGGLHHAAAAVGTPAIVIFGGFIPPAVTGYASHINLAGAGEACGSWSRCDHCRRALNSITVESVYGFALELFNQSAATSRRAQAVC